MFSMRNYLLALLCAALAACGGSGSDSVAAGSGASTTAAAGSGSSGGAASSSGGASSTSGGVVSSSGGTTSSSGGSSSSGTSSSGTSGSSSSSGSGSGSGSGSSSGGATGVSKAAQLAAKLGRPSRLLIGLGGTADTDVTGQGLTPDIFAHYLSNLSWPTWNTSPDFVGVITSEADALGAVPMFTLYQMATDGESNMSVLTDNTFMTTYWANVRLLFQDLGRYGKPALVNLEPDFWGFVQQQASGGDPTQVPAMVTMASECSGLPNNVVGVARCLVTMARKYAPEAYIGFPPSGWGANTQSAVIAFMNQIGAASADFIVMQTLDRDAGCFEAVPQPSYCTRPGNGLYWDESNQTHPDFTDHLTAAQAYHTGIGGLPLIWWQTPLGVPSTIPGTDGSYRDNREHYFLTHPAELTAVGGLGVVFSAGETHQTTIKTDGGQFASLSSQYLAHPAALP